jgi:Tol biopolymer transport system component
MEHLVGQTLAERLKKGPLPLDQALEVATQIADALSAAHKQGIIHRDLKPGNVMLTKTGARLLDFGLARLTAHGEQPAVESLTSAPTEQEPLTGAGTVMGTLPYMAPEQLEGKEADARTDIFGYGAVLYEMVTGTRAFEGKSQPSLMAAILEHDPPPISTLRPLTPPALDQVVMRCLAKNPDERWQSVSDVMHQVRWISEGRSETAGSALAAATRRERVAWVLAGAGLIAAVLLGFVNSGTRNPGTAALRFTVSPPPETAFAPTHHHQSVSPDGRRIAFIAQRRREPQRLWVRSFGSLEAEVLAGTDGVFSLFWSPDAEFLGFFAEGTLKKVPVSGGPVIALCEAPTSGLVHGTWGSDVILFGSDATGGVSAVPAGGGVPKPVTTVDTSAGDTRHTFPAFLPDGDRFLYLSLPSNTVYLGSLASAGVTRLLTADSKALSAEPGYLLFIRDGVLLGQQFDEARGRLTGDPVALAAPAGVNPLSGGGRFSVSDNGVLAYRAGQVGVTGELMWFDRAGRSLASVERPARRYQALDLSPDGRHLAIAMSDSNPLATEVWTVDVARGGRVRLGQAPSLSPVWSPDGREVVFSAQRDGGRWILYRTLGNGADEPRVIHEFDARIDATDWSPDGQVIAYVERHPQSEEDIWFLSTTGGQTPTPFVQTAAREGSAQFSPNGRWVAYVSNGSGRPEVYVRQSSGSGDRFTISTEGGTLPRWRADGTELVYFDAESYLVSVEVRATGSTLQIGSPQRLFSAEVPSEAGWRTGPYGVTPWQNKYALSPDGQQVLLISASKQQFSLPIVIVTNWRTALGK